MTSWRGQALIALALLGTSPVAAASLRMTPIGLDLTAPEKAGSISLTNTADEPVNLQVRIFKWTQVEGRDELTETRDVIASPPVATIKGGDTYTLRAVRVSSTPVSGEETYRLVIDELPKPIDPRATGQGVRMVLRSSMPVFFAEKDIRPDLAFKVWAEGGKTYLEATNKGRRHAKLAGMKLVTPQGELSFGGGLNGYVLAGQTMRFEAPTDKVAPAAAAPGPNGQEGARTGGNPASNPASNPGVTLAAGPAELVSGQGSSLEVRQRVSVETR